MSLPKPIRFAREEDLKRILEIYSPYVLNSAISFETEVPEISDFQDRFEQVTAMYPWLVYQENDDVIGYAYGSPHRSRCAYSWSCEVSVYVDESHHKKGIGTALYQALFPILRKQGFYNLFAGITQPNEASNKIHSKLGFEKIGTYKNIGYKFSRWYDVSWYQLEINSGGEPRDPVAIREIKM